MLYRCLCKNFHPANNNYRYIARQLIIDHLSSVMKHNCISSILFFCLEPGGLYDEEKIIAHFKKYKNTAITIILIEPLQNNKIQSAHKTFFEKYKNKKNVSLFLFNQIKDSFDYLKNQQFDYVSCISLDPFFHFYTTDTNNEIDPFLLFLKNKSTYGIELFLYSVKNYLFKEILEYKTWNNFLYKKNIIHCSYYLHSKRNILYKKEILFQKKNKITI